MSNSQHPDILTPKTEIVRVLLVDDHPFVRDGVIGVLKSSSRYVVIGEASTAAEAIISLKSLQPDLLITDLRLPDADGSQVLEAAKAYQWSMYSVVLSAFNNEDDMLSAVRLGASAYLIKTASREELLTTLDRVMTGENVLLSQIPAHLQDRLKQKDLTKRELEILTLIGRGLSNKQMAVSTKLSENTIKAHLKNIFRKLNVTARSEVASIAVRRGLVS